MNFSSQCASESGSGTHSAAHDKKKRGKRGWRDIKVSNQSKSRISNESSGHEKEIKRDDASRIKRLYGAWKLECEERWSEFVSATTILLSILLFFLFWMRSRISIEGCVRPSVCRSICPSVGHTRVETMQKCCFRSKLLSVQARTHLLPCIRPCFLFSFHFYAFLRFFSVSETLV